MIDHTFFRYIPHRHAGSVWASGFDLHPLARPHGDYSALGEFMCFRGDNTPA